MSEWRHCQFCKAHGPSDRMVKYSVRHYAHYDCYINYGKPFEPLAIWQLERFPYFKLKDLGRFAEFKAIYDRKIAEREEDQRRRCGS